MERKRSVYNEIKALRKQLDEAASSVKKGRSAGQQLLELLGVPSNRRRLAAEAKAARRHGPNAPSTKTTQRVALAEMWRVLIHSAVASVHALAQGKSKLTLEDIRLPHKMILLCNQHDDLFDDEHVVLGKDQVKLLYSFCVDMLDEEQTKEIYGAEVELLAMLLYMCKRRECVAYFKPEQHIAYILELVEKRILVPHNEGIDPGYGTTRRMEIAQPAANIFSCLFSTCQELGIDLHVVLPRTIKFVATWCIEAYELSRQQSREYAIHAITYPLLAGAAILLRANPDLAVGSLTRHGQPIVKTIKLSFATFDSPMMTKAYQTALIDITLRYL
jgi:hypothetical protein